MSLSWAAPAKLSAGPVVEPNLISDECTLKDFRLLVTGDGMDPIVREVAARVDMVEYNTYFATGNYERYETANLLSADVLELEVPTGPNRRFFVGGVIYGGDVTASSKCISGPPAHLIGGFRRINVLSKDTGHVTLGAHFVEGETDAYPVSKPAFLEQGSERTGFVEVEIDWGNAFTGACQSGKLNVLDVSPGFENYSVRTHGGTNGLADVVNSYIGGVLADGSAVKHYLTPLLPKRTYSLIYRFYINATDHYRYSFRISTGPKAKQARTLGEHNLMGAGYYVYNASLGQMQRVADAPWPIPGCI